MYGPLKWYYDYIYQCFQEQSDDILKVQCWILFYFLIYIMLFIEDKTVHSSFIATKGEDIN